MLKSMTAYGRASVLSPLGHFSVEIQSVNRKHLEVNTYLPKEFLRFDSDVKKWISSVVGRGQVNVKISVSFEKTSPLKVTPNIALGNQVKDAWHTLAQQLKIHVDEKALINILSHTDGIMLFEDNIEDEVEYKKVLQEAIEEALEHLLVMKIKEGKALHDDILARVTILSTVIKQVAEKSPGATTKYEEKLKERIEEVLGKSIENEERILREVCVYADKIDITEELTRFYSHLVQMKALLNSQGQSVGKTLEFLIQELNREINTIGSKSSDVDISRFVIEIKTELERIREQIQNIE